MSLGKPRNGLRRGLGHLSYIWWVSRIQIFKFSNVTVTFSRNNGYKTVTFFKNFENVHTCCCNPGAREFMVQRVCVCVCVCGCGRAGARG